MQNFGTALRGPPAHWGWTRNPERTLKDLCTSCSVARPDSRRSAGVSCRKMALRPTAAFCKWCGRWENPHPLKKPRIYGSFRHSAARTVQRICAAGQGLVWRLL